MEPGRPARRRIPPRGALRLAASCALLCASFAAAAAAGGPFELTLLHTNDVHARVEETSRDSGRCHGQDCYGGVARRATKIRQLRAQHPNVLLLDAGDQYQGTVWFSYFKGKEVPHFMNLLRYDAMTLGNHEFDNGVEGLLDPLLKNVNFPVVSANIKAKSRLASNITGYFLPYKILQVGSEKVGIVGYTSKETPVLSNPGQDLYFEDEITALQPQVDKLTTLGVNKIIALGHSGFTVDKNIAQKVKGVDVVIGGHTNTFLYTGVPPSSEKPEGTYPFMVKSDDGRDVPVVQAYAFGKYLGYLNVVFDDKGNVLKASGNPILLNSSVAEAIPSSSCLTSRKPSLPSIRWLPESARWLLTKKEVKAAHDYLSRCARVNGKKDFASKITPEVLKNTVSLEESKNYFYWHLMKTPKLRKTTLCSAFVWFGVAFTYYGISLDISGFSLDPYMTQFIFGAIEIPAKVGVYFVLDHIGRRHCQAWTLIATASLIVVKAAIPAESGHVRSAVAILGKGFSEASFTTAFLYTAELYPTVLRQSGVGCCSFSARMGSAIAPLIMLLGDTWRHLPPLVFSMMAALSGMVAFLLKETTNVHLSETIEDVEEGRDENCFRTPKQEPDVDGAICLEQMNGSIREVPALQAPQPAIDCDKKQHLDTPVLANGMAIPGH